jgi:hypothetical protein
MSNATPPHDLFSFLKQSSDEIQAEYERIVARSANDPGTAGDEGEENWRKLFSDWLPPAYRVVTKGCILFPDGALSPQIDVVVLNPEYPRGLAEAGKKVYLAGGVLAVFECKLTLRSSHFKEAFACSRFLAEKSRKRWGSPYRELHKPMLHGLLAHSHEWTAPASQPAENVSRGLRTALEGLDHPRSMLDVVCVSNLGTWTAFKTYVMGSTHMDQEHNRFVWQPMFVPFLHALYGEHRQSRNVDGNTPFTNVGALVVYVLTRLGRERPDLRPIADFFHSVPGLAGDAIGTARDWPFTDVFSDPVREAIDLLRSRDPQAAPLLLTNGIETRRDFWSEWNSVFGW